MTNPNRVTAIPVWEAFVDDQSIGIYRTRSQAMDAVQAILCSTKQPPIPVIALAGIPPHRATGFFS